MDMLVPEPELLDADGDRACNYDLVAFCRRAAGIIDAVPGAEVPSRISAVLRPLLATPGLLAPERREVPTEG
jgi:hypothetical protein